MTAGKQTKAPRPNGPSPWPFDHTALLASVRRAVSGGSEAQAKAFGQMVDTWQQCLKFTAQRLDRDRALVQDLAAVSDPAELSGIWMRYFETANQDYRDESRQVMGLFADGVREATANARHQLEDVTQAAPEVQAETLAKVA